MHRDNGNLGCLVIWLIVVAVALAVLAVAGAAENQRGGAVAAQRAHNPQVPGSTPGPAKSPETPGRRRAARSVVRNPLNDPAPAPAGFVTRRMRVTAYCPCRRCCGRWADGRTACGKPVTANGGRFVAADRAIPFGRAVSVPGYAGGRPVPVLDRGGAIRGDRLDVFFPTHDQALTWGVQYLEVRIWSR